MYRKGDGNLKSKISNVTRGPKWQLSANCHLFHYYYLLASHAGEADRPFVLVESVSIFCKNNCKNY